MKTTDAQGTQEEWRVVFLFMSLVLLTTGTFFNFFGSADVQKWAVPPKEHCAVDDSTTNEKKAVKEIVCVEGRNVEVTITRF